MTNDLYSADKVNELEKRFSEALKRIDKKTSNEQGTANDGNTLLVAGTNEGLSIGFTCEICSGTQTLHPAYYRANQIFPVCDECKKDLKEFVVSKRQGACR